MTTLNGKNKGDEDFLDRYTKSWLAAREYTKLAGNISALFSSNIRLIHHEVEVAKENPEADISQVALKASKFLVKVSPTLKFTLLKAATDLYGENMDGNEKAHMEKLAPDEITSVFALLFLYRRVKKVVNPDEWARLEPMVKLHMEVGGLVGSTFTFVGRGNGMLAAGARCLSYALMSAHDLDGFQKARRAMKDKDRFFCLHTELDTWGCTHLQVASELLRKLGFMQPYSFASLGLGLNGIKVDIDAVPESIMDNYLSWHLALECTELLHRNGELKAITDQEDPLYIPPEELKVLNEKTQAILQKDRGYNWFATSEE